MEGFHCYQPSSGCDQTGLTLPLAEYGHDLGCAVIGGVVVRDPRQGRLDGRYLFGDACSDNLWLMDPTGDGRREPVLGRADGWLDQLDRRGRRRHGLRDRPRIRRAAADLGTWRLTVPVRRSGRSR